MIDVSSTVEVDHRLESESGLDVVVRLGRGNLVREVIVRGYVGVVMFAVMQLHYLAGDGGFERAIVVCSSLAMPVDLQEGSHGRSGRVAFWRTKVFVAVPTLLVEAMQAADLRPVDRTDVLSSDKAMVVQFSGVRWKNTRLD